VTRTTCQEAPDPTSAAGAVAGVVTGVQPAQVGAATEAPVAVSLRVLAAAAPVVRVTARGVRADIAAGRAVDDLAPVTKAPARAAAGTRAHARAAAATKAPARAAPATKAPARAAPATKAPAPAAATKAPARAAVGTKAHARAPATKAPARAAVGTKAHARAPAVATREAAPAVAVIGAHDRAAAATKGAARAPDTGPGGPIPVHPGETKASARTATTTPGATPLVRTAGTPVATTAQAAAALRVRTAPVPGLPPALMARFGVVSPEEAVGIAVVTPTLAAARTGAGRVLAIAVVPPVAARGATMIQRAARGGRVAPLWWQAVAAT